jgi:hypothetical protein
MAKQTCLGNLVRVPRGPWRPPLAAGDRGNILGLVVVEGVLAREASLGSHRTLELLCQDDILLLPTADERPAIGNGTRLTALVDVELVVLSDSYLRAAARWPPLLLNLHRRLESQRQRFAIQALTTHLPRAEDRILLMLWHLADSCGRVTRDGTVLPLSLTHDVIGQLTAARRPTVTRAFNVLQSAGYVERRPAGCLLLTPAAREKITLITQTNSSANTVGDNIVLRRFAMLRDGSGVHPAAAAQGRRDRVPERQPRVA